MTVRQLYDNILSELNKVEAPSILLEDFIYFANKGVQQYVNKVYNRYDINQQATDDLQTLKATSMLKVECDVNTILPSEDAYYFVYLPEDYLHLLNCIVIFEKNSKYIGSKCSDSTKTSIKSLARRLTSDLYPNVMNNAYFKPSYKVPYYFITSLHPDVNNELLDSILNPRHIHLSNNATLEKILDPCSITCDEELLSNFKLEIRCGSTKKYIPNSVYIDYVRVPQRISLTYNELESEMDTTRMLEFPEYVCYEIVNECVKLIMENASDPRLESNLAINQTIGTNVSQNK